MPYDWRSYFPRGVLDPNGPDGEPIATPTDRRMLWHIESALTVSATTPSLRALGSALRAYLHETCQHEWRDRPICCTPVTYTCVPAHRQCLWCNDVEWADEVTRTEQ